jgi:hypothetical protein
MTSRQCNSVTHLARHVVFTCTFCPADSASRRMRPIILAGAGTSASQRQKEPDVRGQVPAGYTSAKTERCRTLKIAAPDAATCATQYSACAAQEDQRYAETRIPAPLPSCLHFSLT